MANPALEPQSQKKTRYLLIGAFAVVAVMTVAMLVVIFARLTDLFIPEPVSIVEVSQGGVSTLNPPRELADFTLTAHTGEPFSLSDLQGKAVVLSFGYTYCPDVCPLNLMEYRRIQESLGDKAENAAFVFISVDGERDTPERLNQYLSVRNVDDFAVALTGTEGELRSMGVDYGLFFQKNYADDSEFYMVDHTASTYLIDPQGRLTTIFAFGTEYTLIADAMLDALS